MCIPADPLVTGGSAARTPGSRPRSSAGRARRRRPWRRARPRAAAHSARSGTRGRSGPSRCRSGCTRTCLHGRAAPQICGIVAATRRMICLPLAGHASLFLCTGELPRRHAHSLKRHPFIKRQRTAVATWHMWMRIAWSRTLAGQGGVARAAPLAVGLATELLLPAEVAADACRGHILSQYGVVKLSPR